MDINFNGPTYINNFNTYSEKKEDEPTAKSTTEDANAQELSTIADKPLPTELSSQDALRLLNLAQQQGWLDDNYQPRLKTKEQVAILAGRISSLLWGDNRWAIFQDFWGQKLMAQAYQNGLNNKSQKDFFSDVVDVIK